MQSVLFKVLTQLRLLLKEQHGQDLVEYALVVALIAFGATAGMKALADGLNKGFGQISTNLGSYVT
jgi:pilus assembly protein Flp/PilA